jgi:predicted nucleic-acid-binding protein
MFAVDTNIIVRLLTRDDELQYKAAHKLFQKEAIFIADSVILETEWVLRFAYDFDAQKICSAFKKLFGLKNVHLGNPLLVAQAIDWCEAGLDFSDAFHLALSQNSDAMKTFDDKFIKGAKKHTDCTVEKP